ncbi:hypothetical protein EPVG_00240 [Emiliania huxleyi virus 201]|nr:hypothetical protein EPVG_00240 [Emiliania huxleyi virus 201]
MLEGIAPIVVLLIGTAAGMGTCLVTMLCFYLSCCGRILCSSCSCIKNCVDRDGQNRV